MTDRPFPPHIHEEFPEALSVRWLPGNAVEITLTDRIVIREPGSLAGLLPALERLAATATEQQPATDRAA